MSEKSFHKVLANWTTNELQSRLNRHRLKVDDCGISPEDFGALVWLVYVGWHTRDEARALLDARIKKRLDEQSQSGTLTADVN